MSNPTPGERLVTLIERNCRLPPKFGEPQAKFRLRISHAFLSGSQPPLRVLDTAPFALFPRLTCINASHNAIAAITGPALRLPRLRELNLTDNRLDDAAARALFVATLAAANSVECLYLDQNLVTHLDFPDTLSFPSLHTLSLASQRLPPGKSPSLVSASALRALAPALRWLDVSACQLRSLAFLSPLEGLQKLTAEHNDFSRADFSTLCRELSACPKLATLSLIGAPATSHPRYARELLATLPSLQQLDGKEIPSSQRLFVARMVASQAERKLRSLDARTRQAEHFGSGPSAPTIAASKPALKAVQPPAFGSRQHAQPPATPPRAALLPTRLVTPPSRLPPLVAAERQQARLASAGSSAASSGMGPSPSSRTRLDFGDDGAAGADDMGSFERPPPQFYVAPAAVAAPVPPEDDFWATLDTEADAAASTLAEQDKLRKLYEAM
jgi:hypothetical protein